MLYNLRVVCQFNTPGLRNIDGVYDRHSLHSEDGNILMHVGGTLLRYDPNFVSATLVNPDGVKIAFLDGRDHSPNWSKTAPEGFVE